MYNENKWLSGYRNRPSFPVVYTTNGTRVAAAYNGICTECKRTFQHSSWTPRNDEKQEYFFDPLHSAFFQVTSQTVFEIRLLNEITLQITFSGATFESQAQVYNTMHGREDERRLESLAKTFGQIQNTESLTWKVNEKCLEDAWFLYQLVWFYKSVDCLSMTSLSTGTSESNRRDIEELCESANLHRSLHSPKWVAHCCGAKGCGEGFAIVDGNE